MSKASFVVDATARPSLPLCEVRDLESELSEFRQ